MSMFELQSTAQNQLLSLVNLRFNSHNGKVNTALTQKPKEKGLHFLVTISQLTRRVGVKAEATARERGGQAFYPDLYIAHPVH
jgi:hypothetical protein